MVDCYTVMVPVIDIIESIVISIPNFVLWIVFGVFVLTVIIMNIIFFYHWDRYGTNSITTMTLKVVYTLISTALVILALGALMFI